MGLTSSIGTRRAIIVDWVFACYDPRTGGFGGNCSGALGNEADASSLSSASSDEVSATVALLVEKKKLYADNNDGIGVDGKPFGAGGGAAAAATAGAGKTKEEKGPAKQVRACVRASKDRAVFFGQEISLCFASLSTSVSVSSRPYIF